MTMRLPLLCSLVIGCSDPRASTDGTTEASSSGTSTTATEGSSGSTATDAITENSSSGDVSSSTSSTADSTGSDDMPPWWTDVCASYTSVYSDNASVTTQADVARLVGIECIDGGLDIQTTDPLDPVVDLTPLASLRAVSWNFSVEITPLTSLSGLEQLEVVSGDVNIGNLVPGQPGCTENQQLVDLDGLSGLTKLTNLFVCGDLVDSLESISGLDDALVGELGHVELARLQTLMSIAGFEGVTRLESGLVLNELPLLADLSPLADLTSTANLYVVLTAVPDLHGLEALTAVDQRLMVASNAELATLSGLDALETVFDVYIINNPALPQADAESFVAGLTVTGEAFVCGNLDGPAC